MKTKLFLFLLLTGLILSSVNAQDIDITKHAGYIDLEKIKIPEHASSISEISIGPAMLSMFKSFDDENKKSESMSGLLSIRIKSFNLDSSDSKKIEPLIEQIHAQLKRDSWENIIRVKNEDEITTISFKKVGDKPVGFFLVSFSPNDEVTFANIVGEVDLNKLSKLGMGFNDSTFKNLNIDDLDVDADFDE